LSLSSTSTLRVVLSSLPAVPIAGLLGLPVPGHADPSRHVAGYFQALAYARDGVASLFYLTPDESLSALHFHSLLSAPLVAAGYHEAGRLTSLVAAVGAVVALVLLVRHAFGPRAGLLAGAALWPQPLFLWGSFQFAPETLSIALTTAVLYAAAKHLTTGRPGWAAFGVGILVCAVATHLWEAVVVLPVAVLYATHRRWRFASGAVAIGATTVALVFGATHLQPTGGSTLATYGFFAGDNWRLWTHPGWWFPLIGPIDAPAGVTAAGLQPTRAASRLLLCTAVGASVLWSVAWRHTGDDRALVVLAWLVSGLAIPFALPAGALTHHYYLWGVVAPLAVTAGVMGDRAVDVVTERGEHLDARTTGVVVQSVPVLIALGLVVVATPFVPVVLGSDTVGIQPAGAGVHDDAIDRAADLRDADLETIDGVVFVGNYSAGTFYGPSFGARVLVYSGYAIRGERAVTDPGGVEISDSPPSDCELIVTRYAVSECDTSSRSS